VRSVLDSAGLLLALHLALIVGAHHDRVAFALWAGFVLNLDGLHEKRFPGVVEGTLGRIDIGRKPEFTAAKAQQPVECLLAAFLATDRMHESSVPDMDFPGAPGSLNDQDARPTAETFELDEIEQTHPTQQTAEPVLGSKLHQLVQRRIQALLLGSIARFFKKKVGTMAQAGFAGRLCRESGQHGLEEVRVSSAQQPKILGSVEHRHLEIQHHQVHRPFLEDSECIGDRVCHLDIPFPAAELMEYPLDHLQEGWFVINEQQPASKFNGCGHRVSRYNRGPFLTGAEADWMVDAAQFGLNIGPSSMTTANKISIFRILLVPFFAVQVLYAVAGAGEIHRYLALAAFCLAVISDGVDGFIARHYNQRSELGAILDPLADKLLLLSGIVLLSLPREGTLPQLPLWLTATVLSRDALLLLGLVLIRYIGGTATVRPHLTGKASTVLQMICILWVLLKLDLDWLQMWALAATLLTGVSGAIYVMAGVRQLSASPASSAGSSAAPASVARPRPPSHGNAGGGV
jgi:cardiolipin synthase (CMP-forming)